MSTQPWAPCEPLKGGDLPDILQPFEELRFKSSVSVSVRALPARSAIHQEGKNSSGLPHSPSHQLSFTRRAGAHLQGTPSPEHTGSVEPMMRVTGEGIITQFLLLPMLSIQDRLESHKTPTVEPTCQSHRDSCERARGTGLLRMQAAWRFPIHRSVCITAHGTASLWEGRDARKGHPSPILQKWELLAQSHRKMVPTFQGFLQGLCEASPAMAVTVILAQVLTPWEGQGHQVKVHQRQVMTSYLGKMKQGTRDRLRCSHCLRPLPPTPKQFREQP